MVEYLKRLIRLWPALAFGLTIAGVAMAQGAAVTGSPDDMTRGVAMIVTNATPLIIWALKKWVPSEAAPFIAPLIGAVGTTLINWITGIFVDPFIGTLAGSAGVGAREALDQGKKALGWRKTSPPGGR